MSYKYWVTRPLHPSLPCYIVLQRIIYKILKILCAFFRCHHSPQQNCIDTLFTKLPHPTVPNHFSSSENMITHKNMHFSLLLWPFSRILGQIDSLIWTFPTSRKWHKQSLHNTSTLTWSGSFSTVLYALLMWHKSLKAI